MPEKYRAKRGCPWHRRQLLMLCILPSVGCAVTSSSADKQSWFSKLDPRNNASQTESDATKAQLAVFKERSKSDLLALNAAAQAQLRQVNAEITQDVVPIPTLQDDARSQDGAVSPRPPRSASDVMELLPEGDSSTRVTLGDKASVNADSANTVIQSNIESPIIETADGTEVIGLIDTAQGIDLASALGMAGGNAWTVQLARQKTVEAHANLQQAEALWLPTLQFGVGWNNHSGRIQATDGNVIEASRDSLFVGGGATLGTAPVAGGSGGPLRLIADLALVDAYFDPKIATRQWSASRAGVSVAKNDALLNAGLAYVDLVQAAGQIADTEAAMTAVLQLLNLTETFVAAGAGAQADVDRAATAKARLEQKLLNAQRLFRTRSAILARRLRLDPRFELYPADQVIVPLELLADSSDREVLIQAAFSQRPEVSELGYEIAGLCLEVKKQQVAPWIPLVAVTSSGGSFGGGSGSEIKNQAGRADVDVQALWQLDSLGMGVVAKRKRAASRLSQSRTELSELRDKITAEVVSQQENVMNYRMQIDSADKSLAMAESSYDRNLLRVRADEGLPIELLQAIQARASCLEDRTTAVAGYNRSQLYLLYATGQIGR